MAQNILERMVANNTDYKISVFRQKQSLPYEAKVVHAEKRAREFYNEITGRGYNVHVSVGGLTVLHYFSFCDQSALMFPRSQGWGDVLSYVNVGWNETPREVVETIITKALNEPKRTVKQRADHIVKEAKKAKISMDYLLAQLDTIEELPLEVQEEIIIKTKRNTCKHCVEAV